MVSSIEVGSREKLSKAMKGMGWYSFEKRRGG
jgi:hypothetical protein